MNDEFMGVGRTWITVWAVMVLSTILLGLGKVPLDVWESMMLLAFGGGAAKSTMIGLGAVLGKKEEKK